MEIEILKDIRDSSGEVIYRAGQKDVHVPASVGEHYIFLKEARRPVYKSAPEWIPAKERERQAALPPDRKCRPCNGECVAVSATTRARRITS